MKRWRKQIRLAMIAVAGFVLLVTVLPQVASGIGLGSLANRLDGTTTCSSGSSGSSGSSTSSGSSSSCCSGSSGSTASSGSSGSSDSSGCVAGPGTVTGSVAVTGAPVGFSPAVVGAGVCPEPDPGDALCADPQVALAQSGTYSLSLTAGSYVLWGFYGTSLDSGTFLGTPLVVTVESGGTQIVNTTVPYVKPASVDATLAVTGLPAGVLITSATVTLCPVGITYDPSAQPPLPCATSSDYPTTPTPAPLAVSFTGLPPGQWTAYPGYCTQFGCATGAASPKPVVTTAGHTAKSKLSTPFQIPQNGLLSATVTVSGAPAGFAPGTGIEACQLTGLDTICEGISSTSPGPTTLLLNDGLWVLTGYYTAAPFGNAIDGPTELVTIQGGQTTNLVLDVPYQVLGGITGTIKISGLPAGVHPTGYSVDACPAGALSANPLAFLSCVYEYSGSAGYSYGAADIKRFGRNAHRGSLTRAAGAKLNTIDLPTLTPGPWSITVSYSTQYGTFYPAVGTTVNVTAGATTKAKVVVPYQAPLQGLVTGTVKVTNSPDGAFNAEVRACSSAPTATTCTDEVDATPGQTGTYQLPLLAGTWWVQGESYSYAGPTTEVVTSAAKQIAVVAGVRYKANFVIPLL